MNAMLTHITSCFFHNKPFVRTQQQTYSLQRFQTEGNTAYKLWFLLFLDSTTAM